MIINIAIIIGMIIGSAMILVTLLVYFKHQKFSFGGTVLTMFGTVLIGLSIWANIEVKFDEGGFSFAAHNRLQEESNAALKGIQDKILTDTAVSTATTSFSYGDPIEFKMFDPTAADIKTAMNEIGAGISFGAILSLTEIDQYYIQTAKFPDSNSYRIEYREGSSDQHFFADANKAKAIKAFVSYLNQDGRYKKMFKWEKIVF